MKEFVRISDVNAIIDDRIQKIKDCGRKRLTPAELNLQIVRKEVNGIDAIDAHERRTGRWRNYRDGDETWMREDGRAAAIICSECGSLVVNGSVSNWNFCPNCGSEMVGEDNG